MGVGVGRRTDWWCAGAWRSDRCTLGVWDPRDLDGLAARRGRSYWRMVAVESRISIRSYIRVGDSMNLFNFGMTIMSIGLVDSAGLRFDIVGMLDLDLLPQWSTLLRICPTQTVP